MSATPLKVQIINLTNAFRTDNCPPYAYGVGTIEF